jgi:hypothetical protein
VVRTIAQAPPGGVLVHCVAGRDRTGLITMVLLTLAGVGVPDILADYERSAARLRPLYAELGQPDDDLRVQAYLARTGTTARAAVLAALDGLHGLEAHLSATDLAALRERLTVGGVAASTPFSLRPHGG